LDRVQATTRPIQIACQVQIAHDLCNLPSLIAISGRSRREVFRANVRRETSVAEERPSDAHA